MSAENEAQKLMYEVCMTPANGWNMQCDCDDKEGYLRLFHPTRGTSYSVLVAANGSTYNLGKILAERMKDLIVSGVARGAGQ